MRLDFNQIFDAWNQSTQKVFAHDRTQSVGASEVFDCIRKVFFRKRGEEFGYKKDEGVNSWGATRRGDILENYFIVPALSQFLPQGASLLFAGDDQKTLFKNRNSATPDGLIVGLTSDALTDLGIPDIKSDCIVIEMKTIDPRVGLTEEKQIHHGQAQIQMGLIRDTTDYKPYYAVILYVDASFLDNIKPFIVEYDEKKWQAAQTRANTIWTHNNAADFRPEGKFDGSCALCDFKSACALVSTGMLPPEIKSKKYDVDESVKAQIASLIKEIKDLEEVSSDNKKIAEEKKFEIKELMKKASARNVKADDRTWGVSWYPQEGRESIDTKAMAEDGYDLTPYIKKGQPFEVLRITTSS